MENGQIVKTKDYLYRTYEEDDCKPVTKGYIPKSNCKHNRTAYVDKEFNKGYCPLSSLKELLG